MTTIPAARRVVIKAATPPTDVRTAPLEGPPVEGFVGCEFPSAVLVEDGARPIVATTPEFESL